MAPAGYCGTVNGVRDTPSQKKTAASPASLRAPRVAEIVADKLRARILSGELGDDFTHYLDQSEQIDSVVLLGVLVRPSGVAADSDDTLAFSALSGVRPMIERYPLERAAAAYARMMSGEARFRVVLELGA